MLKRNISKIRLPGKTKRELAAYVLIIPALICLILFVWRPILEGAVLSLYKLQGYAPVKFVGLNNYREIINETLFKKAITNTFAYVLYSFLIGFPLPIIVAIIINEIRYCKCFVRFSIYFPSICPAVIVSLLWTLIYDPSAGGLLNTILSKFGAAPMEWLNDGSKAIFYIVISMTWSGFGGSAILYLSTLQGINKEMYEAAYIDGAGIWKKTWYITLPQISSIIALMAIRQFSGVFQIFNEPMVMTGGGPSNATVTLSLLGYRYGFVYYKLEKALTVGVITFIILFVLTLFYFRIEKKVSNDA